MVNLKHDLTVDDLIVEYMIYKVKNGYEPQFLTSEFIDFLKFFNSQMPVQDILLENKELFKRFFNRKAKRDWSKTIDLKTNKVQFVPHMDMIYSKKDNDYLIKANYRLSAYDISVLNTYFMDNGMSKFDDFKGTAAKIRDIIRQYLANKPKRKIDETIPIDDNSLIIGKYLAAEILKNIWNSYINDKIKYHKWPEQCQDIAKYLLEMDLAKIIGLKSIKKELLDFYQVISKRIAILYQQDHNLRISSNNASYLAKANYNLLTSGYQEIFKIAFDRYKSSLNIDLANHQFQESHEIDRVYMWDEDADIKTTTSQIGNAKTQKLVRTLDKSISNN